jgi:hypothetical protein
MDDEIPIESAEPGPSLKPIFFNILAVFFLVLSCLCPGYSVLVFAAPNSILNPLPPGGFGRWTSTPTHTHTPVIYYPPTWTPTVTLEPTLAITRTQDPRVTPTITLYYDPDNPNPLATQTPLFPFVVEGGEPVYSASPKGCAWMGVAGTVFDATHSPVNNLLVRLLGVLSDNNLDLEQVTGSIHNDPDGQYEFTLADQPVESLNAVSVQLLDGNHNPLSAKIIFHTFVGCDKNLITVNFIQGNS